jgi:hypothetical protein
MSNHSWQKMSVRLAIFFVLAGCETHQPVSNMNGDPFDKTQVIKQEIPVELNVRVKLSHVSKKTAIGLVEEVGFGIERPEGEVIRYGVWETTVDGHLYSRIDYSWNGEGKPNGWAVSYYKNGLMQCKYEVKQGLKSGFGYYFTESGELLKIE